ncbi:hypothetical protein C1H46_023344 [Malus baccata]|uniref:Uncharacterized protein n=1 Tax=Malus baccata TaxID=106549 RepID=A0A540LX35_MALBA|nr:hypothetical protein C1H46_023344 [Malus baccata]
MSPQSLPGANSYLMGHLRTPQLIPAFQRYKRKLQQSDHTPIVLLGDKRSPPKSSLVKVPDKLVSHPSHSNRQISNEVHLLPVKNSRSSASSINRDYLSSAH